MATTTINGITFEVSISEMLELAAGAVKAAKVKPVDNSHADKAAEAIVEKVKRNSDNSGEKILACGHSVPVSRGRYPNKCADCAETVEHTPNKPEKRSGEGQKRNGKGYRRFNRSDDDSWKDNPASEAQVSRILFGQKKADGSVMITGLDGRKTTKANRASITAEIDAGITAGRASELWAEVKGMKFA